MVTMVVWTLVALAAAAVVLVVASVADTRSDDDAAGVRGHLQDVRAGLRTLRGARSRGARPRGDRAQPGEHGRPGRQRPRRDADRAVSDLDDFFAATEVQAPAYVAVDDLADTLTRARQRAARGVSGLTRR